MTWEEIRKEFLKELLKYEERLEKDIREFSKEFLKRLKEQGYQVTPELEAKLSEFVQKSAERLHGLLTKVAKAVAVHKVEKTMRDEFIAKVVKEVFERRWADGRNLSERIWVITDEVREGMKRALREGIRQAKAAQHIAYEMQYEVERLTGERFLHFSTDRIPKWLDDLWETGRKAARDPFARKTWEKVMEKVEDYVEKLSRTGSYYETKKLLNEIRKAVEQGMDELIGRAVNQWLYDRQLYYLRRVARTEAANAFRLAQIKATEDDPDVIGYQWRLSRRHPKPDICDWYANVDFGLGKGVWPKDRVPRTAPHPHCLCYLVERVTPEKKRGAVSFREFWENLPESKKKEVLPRWASKLAHAGVDPNEFLREGGFVKKEEFLRRLGEEKFKALSAIGSALEEVKWRDLKIKPGAGLSKKTLKRLEEFKHIKEVNEILKKIERREPVPSRMWHYLKRKYVDEEKIKSPVELDRQIDKVLKDKEARVFLGNKRYHVISEKYRKCAIIEKDGTRITVFTPEKEKWKGKDLGRIKDLLKIW